MSRRLPLAVLLALLLAGLAAAVWSLPGPPAVAAEHPLRVLGPGGQALWNGTARGGDPLTLLQDAAAQGGFHVGVDHFAGYGPDACDGVYVRSIAGHAETSTGGWNYYVDTGFGYAWVPRSAPCIRLGPGDAVEWRWVEGSA